MSFDYVIVGGGSAGSVLAARLSEDPDRTVLLVEAGDQGPLGGEADRVAGVSFALTRRDWGLRAWAMPSRELDYPQGRFVGGGSSVNGALAFRGLPDDYDRWAREGNPSWSWHHMLRCFRKLERDVDFGADPEVHGSDGPVPVCRYGPEELLPIQRAFRAACEEQGLPWTEDHNRPGTQGVGPLPMNRVGDVRISTAMAYLAPALGRGNLTVSPRSTAVRIRIGAGRALGVDVTGEGGLRSVDAGEVIVSAGSIQSPALLWRSGIGPADELAEIGVEPIVDNPAVGANLTDHPGAFLFCVPDEGDIGPLDPQYQLGARYSSSAPGADTDMLLSMMNIWDLSTSPDFAAAVGVPAAVVITCGVHDPESRGRVSIDSTDPAAPPRIELNLLAEQTDLDRLLSGIRRCRDVALSPSMKGFVKSVAVVSEADLDDDARLADYARSMVAPWYHPVGTCRMGPAASASSVVGDDLSVHGVERLRVVDASVMPRICRAPTNLTAIAIAERAAEILTGPVLRSVPWLPAR